MAPASGVAAFPPRWSMWPARAWVRLRRSELRRNFSRGRVKVKSGEKCWKSSRHSWTSTQLPEKRPSGWSMEVSSATVRGPARLPGSTLRGGRHWAARQQHEAAFRHGVFDHFEPDAVTLGGLRRVWPGVALIHISHLDRASGDLLHVLGKRFDLGAIALIGRGHAQRYPGSLAIC